MRAATGTPDGGRAVKRTPDSPPLYRQVADRLRASVLSAPYGSGAPLPPEGELAATFGVSRGTLRRATEELARDGLLRLEQGRGTYVDEVSKTRHLVWAALAAVARPDSRFDLDLARFIPDFAGSERCDSRLRALRAYKKAATLFVTPDNSLERLRAGALEDNKRLVVPTYGMARGFVLLEPDSVPAPDRGFAATLDGMERFGQHLDDDDLARLGGVDAVVSGAVAVTTGGVHVDGGWGYLGLEWGILAELGLVRPATPLVVSIHGCQVVAAALEAGPSALEVDLAVTPERIFAFGGVEPRPAGLDSGLGATHDALAYVAPLLARPGPEVNELVI